MIYTFLKKMTYRYIAERGLKNASKIYGHINR
jgi:hypothetical protein